VVRRHSAAGHTVNVRMALQGLSPRIQNTEEADISAEAGRIGRNFQQRGGAGIEQEAEKDLLVLPDQWHQRMRHAEHHVEIAHRQQFPSAGAQPLLPCVGLALEAVAVSAGVIRDGLMPTANALIAMSAERGGAAAFDRPEHFELCPRQRTAIAFVSGICRQVRGRTCSIK
jgi:hypothetical protein